ncbi:hypothetical protein OSTOST_12248, partial [Ostertagia ostertagi]
EFAARPIPKQAEELTGAALVDYVNKQQQFFKAEYSPGVAEKRMENLMQMDYVEKDRKLLAVKMPEKLMMNGNDTLPEK